MQFMERNKKILLFTDILCSGGAQRQLTTLASLLRQTGYEVQMLDYWNNTFYDSFLKENCIPFTHANIKGKAKIIRMYTEFVRNFQPDVVISYMENPSVIACISKLLYGGKYKLIVSERSTTQKITILDRIRFYLFKKATYVVPNSLTQTNFIRTHFSFLESKLRHIPNIVDTDKFKHSDSYAKNKCFKFIVVARIAKEKNTLNLIEAINVLKNRNQNFIVDWYGASNPPGFDSICKKRISELQLDNYLFFHLETRDILPAYQQADAAMLLSSVEGFPNVLCEAMSCGLPVIASRVSDIPAITNDGACGFLINYNSPVDIAAKMHKIMQLSIEERVVLGKIGRKLIQTNYSKHSTFESYKRLIDG